MNQLRWEYRVSIFIMAGCLVLIVIMLGEWIVTRNYREEILQRLDETESTGYELDKIPAFKFLQHPIEYYADLVNRPLFNEGRKPIEEILDDKESKQEELVTAPKEDFKLQLIGNIITPDGKAVALFENLQAKALKDRFKRFSKGDEYNGWNIADVRTDRVLINDGINHEEILLRKLKPRPKAKPERRRPSNRRGSARNKTQNKTQKRGSSPASKAFKPIKRKPADSKEPGVQFK